MSPGYARLCSSGFHTHPDQLPGLVVVSSARTPATWRVGPQTLLVHPRVPWSPSFSFDTSS